MSATSHAAEHLAILQIFGPDGGNVPETCQTLTMLQRAAGKLGMPAGTPYQSGGSQALARSELLNWVFHKSNAAHFLWLDSDAWIEGGVREHALVLEQVLMASDDLGMPVSLPYATRLTHTDNAPHYALSFCEQPARVLKLPSGLDVAKLQGTGFGFVHMRRAHVHKMLLHYLETEGFTSEREALGGVQCSHVFRETNARKVFDALDPSCPVRALPEDDSYWHRARAIGEHAYCLVDVPLTHRGCLPDLRTSGLLAT